MTPLIHRIEIFEAEYADSQENIAHLFGRWSGSAAGARILRHVFKQSGIARRHSVLPDFTHPEKAEVFRQDEHGQLKEPTTQDRNRCYGRHAGRIGVEVARRLLDGRAGFSAADVTHVITVSCTGFVNPGPDFNIVTELGMAPSVERYNLGFMGCYAALPALRMARQFCQARPDAVVLVVCIELCSLHMRTKTDSDSILGNALFSDGAAGVIVSALPPAASQPVIALDHFSSALACEGQADMAWEIGNHGFNLVLSTYVPDVIQANIERIVGEVLGQQQILASEIKYWAIHPGGKAILDKVEQSLGLEPWQIQAPRDVLREHGNMSSPTVLFVLKQLLESTADSTAKVAAMAFGPGLTIECALLELIPAAVAAKTSAASPVLS